MNKSITAEQAVLGGIMLDNDRLDDVLDLLERNHFYVNAHQHIFSTITKLAKEGQAVDIVTVRDKLAVENKIESIGGLEYLDQIMRGTPIAVNLQAYANIVFDASLEREMQRIGEGVNDLLHSEGTTQEKLDRFESQVSNLGERKNIMGPVRVDACIAAVIDEIEYRGQQEGLIGLSSGLSALDDLTSGFEKGDVVVLAGTPGAGKTSLAMNVVESAAIKEGKTALVFSLEMPKQQLLMRLMSNISGVPFAFVRSGKLNDQQSSEVSRSGQIIGKSNLYIDDEGALSVLQIRSRARKVHRSDPLDLIVIDYLQLMSGEGDNTNSKLERITPAIKSLAKELNVPIILLSQFNREGSKRKPEISDLRGSGSIEQDADTIIMLWYEQGQDHLMPTVHAIIGKQRNGPTGITYLAFDKSRLKFNNGMKPISSPPTPKKRGYDG